MVEEMLKRIKLTNPDDYFSGLNTRNEKGVYFYRIHGYSPEIHAFIRKYYETARKSGAVIEGGLRNPDNNQLAYYREMLGTDFRMDKAAIVADLRKWLPRMQPGQMETVAASIYETLAGLKQSGKNDNMLKNAYIKFMCWLFYVFEPIVNRLGNNALPKILYEGAVGSYELLLLSMLSSAGCDIVLLQYQGDDMYRKYDPDSSRSDVLSVPGMEPFPTDFSLKQIRTEIQGQMEVSRLYGELPKHALCTNAWLSGNPLEDIRKAPADRGTDQNLLYNCFLRIRGVEDRTEYPGMLYRLRMELTGSGRNVVVVNDSLQPPSLEEISHIKRNTYQKLDQMVMDLSRNIFPCPDRELRRFMQKAFVDVLWEDTEKNLNRLMNKAVYVLCWLNRYQHDLFSKQTPCFFFMGGCRTESEALFCRFLARLPVDVVIFNPDLNRPCCLNDSFLYEVNYPQSLSLTEYPEENEVRAGTAAFHAEQDMTTSLYQDTGIYRNQQYEKADTIILRTMYEEIPILWNQEVRYRPHFNVTGDTVNMPVIFAKVSGVKDGDISGYRAAIKNLVTPDTLVIKNVPVITAESDNPMKPYVSGFLKNGRLQKRAIKSHASYPYAILREPVQDYILEKLQQFLDRKPVAGMGENGTEYTVVATVLNLDKETVRMIQHMDFTKKNPKLLYVITKETTLSLEDTIYAAFLNYIGFDVLFFVPTGYQCVERYFNKLLFEEHQAGEYLYDLSPTVFDMSQAGSRRSLREIIFGRKGR